MSKNVALSVAGVIFILVALLHLARLLMKLNVTIGQWQMPVYASVSALLISGALGVLMFTTTVKK
jgi:hypothetical protein